MKVTVADLIQYLQTFPPETEVFLDKDGWMEEDYPGSPTVQEVIAGRGLFYQSNVGKKEGYIIINN